MEYILRKMEIETLEIRVDIDDTEDQTPQQIRRRLTLAAELGGWDTSVTSNQTVLVEVNDSAVGSKRLGNWND